MSSTQPSNQAGPGWGGKKSGTSYFDFVVAPRPTYIPNSGPPLAPISGLPIHDKDGIILERVEPYGGPFFYLVGYEAKPQLRIGVKPQNILNWVSPRTFENFELERSRLRDARRRISTERKIQKRKTQNVSAIKPNLSTKPATKKQREGQILDGQTPGSRPTRSGSVPLVAPLAGPSRRRRKPVADQPVFASPTTSHKSKGPSLTTPVKGLTTTNIMDFNEIDELYDTDAAILDQLDATCRLSSSRNTSSRSTTTAPMPSHASCDKPESSSKFGSLPLEPVTGTSFRSGDRQRQAENGASLSNPNPAAHTSSGKVRDVFPGLEHSDKQPRSKSNKESKGQTISQRYSNFKPASTMLSKSDIRSHFTLGTSASGEHFGPEDEEEEDVEDENEYDEWEVDDIIEDAILDDRRWYLVKWVGDWDNTWEPAENIGNEIIQKYDKNKLAKSKKVPLDVTQDVHHHSMDGGGHVVMKGNHHPNVGGSNSDGYKLDEHFIFESGEQRHSGISAGAIRHDKSEVNLPLGRDHPPYGAAKPEEDGQTERKPPGEVLDDGDTTSDCTDDLDGF